MPLIPAFQVLYRSDSDSFTTIQLYEPRDQRFYKALNVTPVRLELVYPHTLDSTSAKAPVVREPGGRTYPLQKVIDLDLVSVHDASRQPTLKVALDYSVPTEADVVVSVVP